MREEIRVNLSFGFILSEKSEGSFYEDDKAKANRIFPLSALSFRRFFVVFIFTHILNFYIRILLSFILKFLDFGFFVKDATMVTNDLFIVSD